MQIHYLKSSQRRPIRLGRPSMGEDLQGTVPPAWCRGCGKEVFLRDKEFCPACEKEERRNESENL